ncbi:unnamed protein product [Fusarium graminearum]|nr:unnamed protein product [Fusarium graminearum]
MEALVAVGILCNVMQIVTFGKDALHVYRHVRENGSPDAKLEVYLADASTNYQKMKDQLSRTLPPTSDQMGIIKIGEEAYQSLQRFRTYFKDLFVEEASRKGFRGKLKIAKSGIKTLLRGKELEDLEKDFDRYQQLLQTRLIGRVCDENDAMAILAQDSFNTLDATEQRMIERLAQGHTELSLLVSEKAIETKSHVSNQHKETRTTLGNHLSVTEHKLHSHITESTSSGHEGIKQESDDTESEDDRTISDITDESESGSTASSVPEPTVFARWLGSESPMFWISGRPASGKSTLMKFIATSPDTKQELTAWRHNVKILSHYFWKAGIVMERSLKGFLLSLTHQVLLENDGLLQRMWEDMPEVRYKWSHTDWDLEQLENALLWVVKTAEEPFLLVIDGLDECEDLEKQLSTLSQRPNILDLLSHVKDVKMCVSSREEYTFINYFDGVERLQLHELTKHDIKQFADARLKGLTFSNPEDQWKLLHSITIRASGVFLWVALVVDSVARASRIDNNIEGLI